jgi:hypothetical protein
MAASRASANRAPLFVAVVILSCSSSGDLAGHNLLCGNRLGEINGPALDATDSGNLTPTGGEGSGAAAVPSAPGGRCPNLGGYVTGDGGHGRGDRRRRACMSTILEVIAAFESSAGSGR